METFEIAPSDAVVHALLDILAPGSRIESIRLLPGSFSNSTHLVETLDAHHARFPIVIRRYAQFGSYDRSEKARREYSTLALLQAHSIPATQPLYLDDTGAILGMPGIIVSFVPGKQAVNLVDPLRWARTLATTLAHIHAIPCQPPAEFLLDGNSEAVWFAR